MSLEVISRSNFILQQLAISNIDYEVVVVFQKTSIEAKAIIFEIKNN